VIPAFFAILACAYGVITLYFCWRYYLRRRLPSLVCAFMPLGWVVAFLLQRHHLPEDLLALLFLASFTVALVSISIIINHEMQREYPFR
jgi:hypothetical protein